MPFKKLRNKEVYAVTSYTIKDEEHHEIKTVGESYWNEDRLAVSFPSIDKNNISKININLFSIQKYISATASGETISIATNLGKTEEPFVAYIAWDSHRGRESFFNKQLVHALGDEIVEGKTYTRMPMPKNIQDKFKEIGEELNISDNLETCLNIIGKNTVQYLPNARGSFQ